MSLQNLLNQFLGSSNDASASPRTTGQGFGETLNNLSSGIPGGLAGGAAAGGIMALLIGNKSARKFAKKAAGYGGAAVLGGLAYRAYQQWQNSDAGTQDAQPVDQVASPEQAFISPPSQIEPAFELTLIKAMIAAAKADGHIDSEEQERIFQAVEKMDLSTELKGQVFEYLQQQTSAMELAGEAVTIEQKSELYLASCMAIDLDHPAERAHLDSLAAALALPEGLTQQLEVQVRDVFSGAD